MLREDIVEAVKEKKFSVYGITTIDEGLELLTGIAAGERQKQMALIQRLASMAACRRVSKRSRSGRGTSTAACKQARPHDRACGRGR